MPFRLIKVDDGVGIMLVGSGVVTSDEYRSVMRPHLTEPPERFEKYRFHFSDHTDVSGLDLSVGVLREMGELAVRAAQINPRVTISVAAPSDEVFGLVRMWQLRTESRGWEQEVFRSRNEAERWLKQRVRERFGIEVGLRPVE